jgi:hypothetical protein
MKKTFEEKKEFALSQLAPYYANPSTCGYDKDKKTCEYLTTDGRMCVAGKNMIEPKIGLVKGIVDILADLDHKQEGLFKPEVVGILTSEEWEHMQSIHDSIALEPTNKDRLKIRLLRLNLFTIEEFEERAELLKNNLVV